MSNSKKQPASVSAELNAEAIDTECEERVYINFDKEEIVAKSKNPENIILNLGGCSNFEKLESTLFRSIKNSVEIIPGKFREWKINIKPEELSAEDSIPLAEVTRVNPDSKHSISLVTPYSTPSDEEEYVEVVVDPETGGGES